MDKNEFTKRVPVSSPNNHSRKNIAKRKSRWSSEVIQKKAKKEDCSDEMDQIEKEIKEPSLFDLSLQIKELQEVKVKTEPKVLEDDQHPIEFTTFTCQTDMDIKQDSEDDKTEITNNGKEDTTSICDQMQTKLVTEPVEEDETVQVDLEEVLSSKVKFPHSVATPFYKCSKYNYNFNELVPPYNCEEDGFPSCPFKTLYFDEYLKHVEAIHQINGLSSFSSEDELLRGAIMEGWLRKEVGPFQCRYCKKATVTHQEMGRHQVEFHAQEQCLFFYRKFVPNDTVTNPEQVNLEDPSFINHVIQLPDQVHLCDFKLTDVLLSSTYAKLADGISETSQPLLPKLEVPHDEPEILSMSTDNESSLLSMLDPLCLDKKLPNDGGIHDNAILGVQLTGGALQKPSGRKCKWKGCYRTCNTQTAFIKHIKKNHVQSQSGKEFTCFWRNCPRKSKPFILKHSLLIHTRVHSRKKPYKCALQGCNKAFSLLENLKVHQREHPGERPYQCQYSSCFKKFSNIYDKNYHQRLHYNPEAYACQVSGCSKKYGHPSNLWRHMKIHKVDKQLVEKPYKCVGCNEAFSRSENLMVHQRGHTGERPYQCQFSNCFKRFSNIRDKDNHQKLHSNPEAYACQVTGCSKKYGRPSHLWRHMKTHTIEEQLEIKPYKCAFQDCNKAFSGQKNLTVHQKEHTEKSYQCQYSNCFKKFSTVCEKNYHQRLHSNPEAYACPVTGCSKKYNHPSHLRRHKKTHTLDEQLRKKTYKCVFQGCNKAFQNRKNLTVHERGHSGEKPYHCQYSNCFKKFSNIYDKNYHQTLHCNPEAYACQVTGCSKKYSHPSNLGKHMKIHTVDEQLESKCKSVEKLEKKSSYSSIENKHYDNEPYTYQVSDCSKTYADLKSFQKHMENDTVDEELEVKQKLVKNEQMEDDFIIYHL